MPSPVFARRFYLSTIDSNIIYVYHVSSTKKPDKFYTIETYGAKAPGKELERYTIHYVVVGTALSGKPQSLKFGHDVYDVQSGGWITRPDYNMDEVNRYVEIEDALIKSSFERGIKAMMKPLVDILFSIQTLPSPIFQAEDDCEYDEFGGAVHILNVPIGRLCQFERHGCNVFMVTGMDDLEPRYAMITTGDQFFLPMIEVPEKFCVHSMRQKLGRGHIFVAKRDHCIGVFGVQSPNNQLLEELTTAACEMQEKKHRIH